MGKDKKKKGKGAEKTAVKTEKKLASKMKKNLALKGEEDIESIIKAIESEEKKRLEVKERRLVEPPSHRCNFSISAHPDNPELVIFGGEFYNGKTNLLNNDLLIYNLKRREWTEIKSPGGPPPRCAHQAVLTGTSGGQLWIFGGEFTNSNETQFYHYKDLWCFHFSSKRWEKIDSSGGPSSRSGHRMLLFKRHLLVFGGFHDNLRECKYFNDVHIFSLDDYKWKKIEGIGSKAPDPRSACCLFPSSDGKGVIVFGGFRKEKKASGKKKDGDDEVGKVLSDMFAFYPDKHDETLSKWRWSSVKQIGYKPSLRSGMSCAYGLPSGKIFFFGGVLDKDLDCEEDDDDDEIEASSTFYNELFYVTVENERAVWHSVEINGKRNKGNNVKDVVEPEKAVMEVNDNEDTDKEPTTLTVESGAFTITSTIGQSSSSQPQLSTFNPPELSESDGSFAPSPRYASGLVIKQSSLYLYGGVLEDDEGRQITLKDFYCLDLKKMDEWETIVKSDIGSMEWTESESEDDSDDESDDMNTD